MYKKWVTSMDWTWPSVKFLEGHKVSLLLAPIPIFRSILKYKGRVEWKQSHLLLLPSYYQHIPTYLYDLLYSCLPMWYPNSDLISFLTLPASPPLPWNLSILHCTCFSSFCLVIYQVPPPQQLWNSYVFKIWKNKTFLPYFLAGRKNIYSCFSLFCGSPLI